MHRLIQTRNHITVGKIIMKLCMYVCMCFSQIQNYVRGIHGFYVHMDVYIVYKIHLMNTQVWNYEETVWIVFIGNIDVCE